MEPGTASNGRKLHREARGLELLWQHVSTGFRVVLDIQTIPESPWGRCLSGEQRPGESSRETGWRPETVLCHKHHRGKNKKSLSADKYCHPTALFIFDDSVSQGNRKCKRKECLYFGRAGLVKFF